MRAFSAWINSSMRIRAVFLVVKSAECDKSPWRFSSAVSQSLKSCKSVFLCGPILRLYQPLKRGADIKLISVLPTSSMAQSSIASFGEARRADRGFIFSPLERFSASSGATPSLFGLLRSYGGFSPLFDDRRLIVVLEIARTATDCASYLPKT